MSHTFDSEPRRERPSYGQSAPRGDAGGSSYDSSTTSGGAPGADAPRWGEAPQYDSQGAPENASAGQSASPSGSADHQGVANGQHGYQAPQYAQQGQWSNPNSSPDATNAPGTQGNQGGHFGGYGNNSAAPVKKQKPIGIILTVLGALILIGGLVLGGVGLYKAGSAAMNSADDFADPSTTNSEFADGTATYEFTSDSAGIFMIYVPEADASTASCSATLDNGAETMTQSNDPVEGTVQVDGQPYVMHKEMITTMDEGNGTISCENVSAPVVVQGPIDLWGVGGWALGGLLGGGLLSLLGLGLLIAGLITMLVRASNRKKAAQR